MRVACTDAVMSLATSEATFRLISFSRILVMTGSRSRSSSTLRGGIDSAEQVERHEMRSADRCVRLPTKYVGQSTAHTELAPRLFTLVVCGEDVLAHSIHAHLFQQRRTIFDV